MSSAGFNSSHRDVQVLEFIFLMKIGSKLLVHIICCPLSLWKTWMYVRSSYQVHCTVQFDIVISSELRLRFSSTNIAFTILFPMLIYSANGFVPIKFNAWHESGFASDSAICLVVLLAPANDCIRLFADLHFEHLFTPSKGAFRQATR